MFKSFRAVFVAILLAPAAISVSVPVHADCWQNNVAQCFESNQVGGVQLDDARLESGVKDKAIRIANRVITIAAVFAAVGIVMAGFHMVTAFGDEEKHKKGKESLKWAILGFALALVSFPLVNAIINFFYKAG